MSWADYHRQRGYDAPKLSAKAAETIRIVWAAREVDTRLQAPITLTWLARYFGVSTVAVWKIVHGQTYA